GIDYMERGGPNRKHLRRCAWVDLKMAFGDGDGSGFLDAWRCRRSPSRTSRSDDPASNDAEEDSKELHDLVPSLSRSSACLTMLVRRAVSVLGSLKAERSSVGLLLPLLGSFPGRLSLAVLSQTETLHR